MDSKLTWIMFIPFGKATRTTETDSSSR